MQANGFLPYRQKQNYTFTTTVKTLKWVIKIEILINQMLTTVC